ncbi:MAG TPA: polysaccharide pyruvyl transferase family protein [Nitriliruptorales bacterium]|nr:polysaccharide pyruvyl transferase family protein [Nitriliruptorales bacterium]
MTGEEGRTLVTGWFSFLDGEATAGDLASRDVVSGWLEDAGIAHDVAMSPMFGTGVDWRSVDPAVYRSLVFVCGPAHGAQVRSLRDRFRGARAVAVNVSIVDPADAEMFDVVLARDSANVSSPDLSVLHDVDDLPVVGVVLAHPQPEYGEGLHHRVADTISRSVASFECASVALDTRVDPHADASAPEGRSVAEVEAAMARMDAVVSSRLHGFVLALKRGVPAVAVDPVPAGAKVTRQAEALGWPAVIPGDGLTEARIHETLRWCLTPAARSAARACVGGARTRLSALRDEVVAQVRSA